jgi:hypothetical protein
MHSSFEMSENERIYYKECLKDKWDTRHFIDSMEYYYSDATWFDTYRLGLTNLV